MKIDKTKYIASYAAEAREHLKKISDGFLAMEKGAVEQETLNDIFRAAHTIKGSARMLGLNQIGEVSHKLEDALEALKNGKIKTSRAFYDAIFQGLDVIAGMIEVIKSGGENIGDISEIVRILEMASKGNLMPDKEPETAEVPAPPVSSEPEPPSAPLPTVGAPAVKSPVLRNIETVRVDTEKLDDAIKIMGEMVSNQSRLKQHLAFVENLRKESGRHMDALAEAEGAASGPEGLEMAQHIFLQVKQFHMNYKNDLIYHSLLMDELLEKVSRMRMLPLSTTLDSFPRYVRDIAASCGKKAELGVSGADTEMDKKIIEKIGDALLHMVRNSVDHGIEIPEERISTGKPETGAIRITAGYEGGSAFIEVADDGGGIPLDKVKEKAIQKRLHTEEELERMTEQQLLNLIFRPGFSTSAFITDISGRGVGMDVVKENIVEQLKGSIQVKTEAGKGTAFRIRLPLTLAIMRMFLVSVSDVIVGIMVSSITEVLKIKHGDMIDVVDKKAVRLRERLIPVVDLRGLLGLPPKEYRSNDSVQLAMLQMGNEELGLVVDSLISEEDMEIKPLPRHLRSSGLISGVSITGKNDIVIVLNVSKAFGMAREISAPSRVKEERVHERPIHILVVDDSVNTREIERSILESYGYQVDVATDGLNGYEKAQGFKYDLVVTDVEMPRMDGFTLTEKLRKEQLYRHTPVIIVSSRDKEEDKRRGMQAGANAYIIKGSFDQSNLLATVQSLIEVMPEAE
ncbi:MAG: hybrid sensor histidine kinase/response regulator [Nitrospinae bacterium]|nr:hybrid sensor histidine kinase/response regulator [Nitrospinota bacterium]